MRLVLSFALTFAATAALRAQPPALVAPTGPLAPADEVKKFTLPAGFEVQLVAAEPDIQKPIQMAFDAKGRLWVTTSYHYPFAGPKGKSTDKLFVLSDFGPDGKAKKVQVFADFLNIPIGILPLPDCRSCIVSSVGEILKLADTDGDGKADKTEVLFTGFGTRDTHGMYNSFTLMPDGWVYACHGFSNDSTVKGKDGHEVHMQSGHTFRFRPDGSRIEVYTRGQVNPFGMALDPWFNLYTADCHSKPITQLIPGAYYQSFGKPHDGLGFAPHVTPHDHGSTALCGLTWYDADQFPKQYKGCMFLGNVVTNRINFDRIEWRGSTPVAKELPDFLVSKDPWFRPTDIKLGPDGALYVSDFYNKIIGHYEVDLKHPARDKDHGRVWRIVWKGTDGTAPPPKMPFTDLTKAKDADLVGLLEHPNLAVRLAATNQFLVRKGEWWDVFPHQKLPTGAKFKSAARVYVPFPMLAENAGILKEGDYGSAFPLLLFNLNDPVGIELAVGMIRGMAGRPKWGDETRGTALDLFKPEAAALRDPKVQRALVDAVAAHPHPDFVKPLVELIQKAPAEDTHLRYAARLALRNCLRDGNGWQAARDANPATVADIALGIPSGQSAEFLTVYITRGADPARLAAYAEHVGRYGDQKNIATVIEMMDTARPNRSAVELGALDSLVRGVRARGQRLSEQNTRHLAAIAGRAVSWPVKDGEIPPDTRPYLAAAKLLADLPAVAEAGIKLAEIPKAGMSLALIVKSAKAPQELRFAAMDALMRIDPATGTRNLKPLLTDPATPEPLQERVAVAFAGATDRNAVLDARDVLKDAPYRRAVVIATALAGSKYGPEILLDAIKQGKAPARLLQERAILEKLRAANVPDLDKQVADLTKGLPPADKKLAALIKQRTARFASAKPDKELGAKLFAKHCAACHKIGEQGGKVGPNLDGVGARGLERLLEDTLDPNRNVDAAFRARVLNLADGTTKTGLMLRVEGEVLVMADDQGKEFRVPTKDIEANRETALSPMPANFGEVIPEAEFYHLIAYLLDQKVKDPPKK